MVLRFVATQHAPKHPNTLPKTLPRCSKTRPIWPQDFPRCPKTLRRSPQNDWRRLQDGSRQPKTHPGRPHDASSCAKTLPKRPPGAQRHPKPPQNVSIRVLSRAYKGPAVIAAGVGNNILRKFQGMFPLAVSSFFAFCGTTHVRQC